MKRVTKQKMLNWLSQKDADETVGMAQSGGYCPIATYYREVEQVEDVSVMGNIYYFKEEGDEGCFDLTKWMRKFINLVDMSNGYHGEISAIKAVEALRRSR